jgi:fatty acid synthase, animal type
LFRIYENGIDLDLNKLYPPVEFPVSRGTPMLSPLVKWDHSENYFVTKYEEAAVNKSESFFTVNLSDSDYDYIAGHTIDGE